MMELALATPAASRGSGNVIDLQPEDTGDERQARDSRLAALRRAGWDDLADEFVVAYARLLDPVRDSEAFELDVQPSEARGVLDELLTAAAASRGGSAPDRADLEEFYEDIHAGIDEVFVGMDLASFEESVDRQLEQRETAAREVMTNRTERGAAYDTIWAGIVGNADGAESNPVYDVSGCPGP